MENVVNGVYYCQQERTEELNQRILSRLNPNRLLQSQFDIRAVPTRYVRMPMLDSVNPSSEPILRVPDYSVRQDFNPGNDKSPYAGYANDIDKESNLKRLFHPIQTCAQGVHIPNSESDLYNYSFTSSNQAKQPFPGLFKEEVFSPFNPNTCNLGTNVFYNHTQQQVKNLQSSWCCKPGSYQQEAQQARTMTEQSMRGCKKQAKNVFKNKATQQSNEVLETENPSRN